MVVETLIVPSAAIEFFCCNKPPVYDVNVIGSLWHFFSTPKMWIRKTTPH